MQRRELHFSSLGDVQHDVRTLMSKGYHQTGKWDLSQIAEHLADWLSFPIDGFPMSPWFIKPLIAIMRVTQGKSMYRKFVEKQRMPVGQPTIPQTVHEPGANPSTSVERLFAAIDRFETHQGPLHPSPLFGALNHDESLALQVAHCAHHLSFLVPK